MWRFSVCCSRCFLLPRSLPTLWTAALTSPTNSKVPNCRRRRKVKERNPPRLTSCLLSASDIYPAALVASTPNLQTISFEWHIKSSNEFKRKVKEDKKFDFIHLIQVRELAVRLKVFGWNSSFSRVSNVIAVPKRWIADKMVCLAIIMVRLTRRNMTHGPYLIMLIFNL